MTNQLSDASAVPPRGLRSIARTWFWFILLGTVVGVIVAFGASAITPPTYTARVAILIIPASSTTTGISPGDIAVSQALIPTFAELATTTPVLNGAIAATNASTDAVALGQAVETHVPTGTNLLDISVSDRDPAQAASLANAVAHQLASYAPPDSSGANVGTLVQLTVVDPATPPTTRDGPGLLVRLALGGAIALFLTISIAFLGENLSRGRDLIRRSSGSSQAPGGPSQSASASPPDPGQDLQGGPYALPAWWRRARAAQSSSSATWPAGRASGAAPDPTDDLARRPNAPRDVR